MIKLWRVLVILVPVLAITSALAVRFMSTVDMIENPALSMLGAMFSVIYLEISIFAILASGIVNMVFLARRTASDFFSDRGQLTFTLPVDRDVLYMSKFLNSLIWNSVSTAMLVLAVLTYMLLCPDPESGLVSTVVFDWLAAAIKNSIANDGAMFIFKAICIFVIGIELELFAVVLINYSVIKCRSIGGIGMSIGIMFGAIFGYMLIAAISALGFIYSTETLSKGANDAITILMMLGAIALIGVFDFLMFFDGRDKMKYDLNIT